MDWSLGWGHGEWMGKRSPGEHDCLPHTESVDPLSQTLKLPRLQSMHHPGLSPATSCHGLPKGCGVGVSMEFRTAEGRRGVSRQIETLPSGSKENTSPPILYLEGACPCHLPLPSSHHSWTEAAPLEVCFTHIQLLGMSYQRPNPAPSQ